MAIGPRKTIYEEPYRIIRKEVNKYNLRCPDGRSSLFQPVYIKIQTRDTHTEGNVDIEGLQYYFGMAFRF